MRQKSTDQNPGCLAALFKLLDLIGNAPVVDSSDPRSCPFRIRDDFLSPAEFSFYSVARGVLDDSWVICPKVALADIFFVVRPNENLQEYNRINRKHVDFLVCEAKTMKPAFGIELDDHSHSRADRVERDEYVQKVFKAAGLPLIRIPARMGYSRSELLALFPAGSESQAEVAPSKLENENAAASVGTPHRSESFAKAPLCPKCGVPMVLRVARQGTNEGKKFYGCPNYPKCREIIEYRELS